MTSFLFEFVCLSLLPSWRWLMVAEGLRAGEPPGDLFARLAHALWPNEPAEIASIRSRAAAAVDRAREERLTPIVWAEPAYPMALAAIVDPPPVLWTRGSLAACESPAVAIVGSRAAS